MTVVKFQSSQSARTSHRFFPAVMRIFYTFAVFVFLLFQIAPYVQAQSSLTPDVKEALTRLTKDAASEKDRALLFANNDAINAARQNREISGDAYQTAQGVFDKQSQVMGGDAAEAAGAKFQIQERSPGIYVEGTDSDYITQVKSKEQIPKMQADYNRRVNQYMAENGISEKRSNWHNKLDVDFMADPEFIKDPGEFRDIAAYNNDAYKNRYAAQYEALSRSKDGGKIGPKHVQGYMEEMNSFANKKGKKVRDILAKGPSYLNDPIRRAELFQAMAQEQKYTSRLESLDDYLRAQEGLPPRNRGTTISKIGSNRAAGNAPNIVRANAVGDASRFSALEDLAETMGQVSKNNPGFNVNAADDIARIVDDLPPGRRAGVLSRIRLNGSPGLADDIVAASRRAGRLPAGSATLADDLARASLDDLAKVGSKLDSAADIGKARRALNAAGRAMDVLGKAAVTAEVALAAAQLGELFDLRAKILDPDTTDEEAAALIERAGVLSQNLAGSSVLAALAEKYPAVAIAYGTWTIACAGGEWVSPTRNPLPPGARGSNCVDRQLTALDRLTGRYGSQEGYDAQSRGLCEKFVAAVREKRLKPRGSFTVLNVCDAIRYRLPIGEMVEQVIDTAGSEAPDENPNSGSQQIALVPPSCDPAQNEKTIVGLRAAASEGSPEAIAHMARLENINGQIASARAMIDTARSAFSSGDIEAVRASLNKARAGIDAMAGAPACPGLMESIVSGLDKADRLEVALVSARDAISSCSPEAIRGAQSAFGELRHPEMSRILAAGENINLAQGAYQQARATFIAGNLIDANNSLQAASDTLNSLDAGMCPNLRNAVDASLAKVEKLRGAINTAEQAVVNCDNQAIVRWTGFLAKIINPATASVKTQLNKSKEVCENRNREERIAQSNAQCKSTFGSKSLATPESANSDKPVCNCEAGYQWSSDNTSCVKAPSKEQLAAERDRYCRGEHGAGYYAGPADAGGSYYCLPTKKTANKWCRDNNQGGGWKANTIGAEGGYSCSQNRAQMKKTARADCRRQAKQNGKVYAYTQFLKNGRYSCNWCESGFRYKDGGCYPRNASTTYSCPKGYYLKGKRCYPRQANTQRRKKRKGCVTYSNPDGSLLGGGGSTSTICN